MTPALRRGYLVRKEGNMLYKVESSQRDAAGREGRDKTVSIWERLWNEREEGRCWKWQGQVQLPCPLSAQFPTHNRERPVGSWIR